MCDSEFGNRYKDKEGNPVKDSNFIKELKKGGTIKASVNNHNSNNPSSPYRFKSYAELIAYEKSKRKGSCS
jgi:hypothetical protein